MSMFQPAISAEVAGRPMPYRPCACAVVTHASMTTASIRMQDLRILIGHLAVGCDAPGPYCVVVVIIIFAANCEKFGQRRLHITGFIDGAALNDRWLAVPMPRKPEPGQRPCQHRLLQLRFLPVLAVIDGDLDAADLAVPAPGNAADLMKPGRAQPLPTRGARDNGFRFHVKCELA